MLIMAITFRLVDSVHVCMYTRCCFWKDHGHNMKGADDRRPVDVDDGVVVGALVDRGMRTRFASVERGARAAADEVHGAALVDRRTP